MPAANTDKLRKKKSLFQTTLNGGISDSDTSLTLQSGSGLPTDTAVTIVINRVDANGVATPSAMEVVTGTVSGAVVSNLVRAEDSTTAKSHANASVVEMVWDADTWNDFVDAYLTEHNQDGTHKPAALSATIVTAAAKTTPVNADSFGIVDSEESNVLKELTFTNLKAFLKTYFDTLYATLTGNQTFSGNNTFSGTNLFTGAMIAKLQQNEGAIINGKLSITDTGSGLTVALKGLDGNDPSATNPVYIILNGVTRSVTSALSVTKADGTNWGNAGAAETAAKEIDWFGYLGYNATDGVTIGFSRIPWAAKYGDFSATTTNEAYCAISTITNAASTDYYAVIGRFAATLSAGAGYTWSVPTYTAVNLIQRPIYETRWLGWLPTYTGFSAAPTGVQKYKVAYDHLKIYFSDAGTSNSATFNFTLPFTPANFFTLIPAHVLDNGAGVDTGVLGMSIGGASATVKVGKTQSTRAANAFAGFTTSGSKGYDGFFEVPLVYL